MWPTRACSTPLHRAPTFGSPSRLVSLASRTCYAIVGVQCNGVEQARVPRQEESRVMKPHPQIRQLQGAHYPAIPGLSHEE
jgi:hypothetical protein